MDILQIGLAELFLGFFLKKFGLATLVIFLVCGCSGLNWILPGVWPRSQEASEPQETYVREERVCRSDADCTPPLSCRKFVPSSGWCTRRWKPWDPPVLTAVSCQRLDAGSTCGASYGCFPLESEAGPSRCAHLPTFVWPVGTGMWRGINEELAQTKTLPFLFPRKWDVRKGPLPPTPDGYVWARLHGCGSCGMQCPQTLKEPPIDSFYTYYLQYATPNCFAPMW